MGPSDIECTDTQASEFDYYPILFKALTSIMSNKNKVLLKVSRINILKFG
jgi:hypothetical protein